jgi:uncharacterized membrane protein YkvA (DUF1232 family)
MDKSQENRQAAMDGQAPLEGDVLSGEEATGFEREESRVRRDFWRTVRKAAGAIPFMEELVAAYYCALDRQTPTRVRATLLGALGYFVLPLDGVPDFILGLGFTDDAAVIMAVLALMQAHISDEHRAVARQALMKDQPA